MSLIAFENVPEIVYLINVELFGSVPFTYVAIDHSYSRGFPLFKRCEWLVVNCNVGKRAPLNYFLYIIFYSTRFSTTVHIYSSSHFHLYFFIVVIIIIAMHVFPKVQSIILFRSLGSTRHLKISSISNPQVRESEIWAIGFLNMRIGLHFRNPVDTSLEPSQTLQSRLQRTVGTCSS